MRTSDRTYAQKLGFSDPDRHNEIHNAAAIYLTADAQIEKFAKLFNLELHDAGDWEGWKPFDAYVRPGLHGDDRWPVSFSHFELKLKWEKRRRLLPSSLTSTYGINQAIIQRSSTGYKNIIGYVDVVININMTYASESEYRVLNLEDVLGSYQYESVKYMNKDEEISRAREYFFKKAHFQTRDSGSETESIAIEVKHGFVDVSSVIQQINTYRTFANYKYIVCTLFPVNEIYKKVLKDHNIRHIYVDPKSVEKFMSAKAESQEEF